jgi:hypothetical protein
MSEPFSSVSGTWIQILEDVQVALQRAEKEALARENAVSRGETRSWSLPMSLNAEEKPTQSWQHRLQQVQEDVQAAELELQAGEKVLQEWRDRLESVNQDLARWAAHS